MSDDFKGYVGVVAGLVTILGFFGLKTIYDLVPREGVTGPTPVGFADARESANRSRKYWGAIAYSSSTGAHSYSYNYPSKEQAIVSAMEKCRKSDCTVKVSFSNGCGALSVGTNALGWAVAGTNTAAESRALQECRKLGRGCKILRWVCTER
jgi:hypothetical protein